MMTALSLPRRTLSCLAGTVLVGAIACIPDPQQPPLPDARLVCDRNGGRVVGDSQIVRIDPTEWVGYPLPITKYAFTWMDFAAATRGDRAYIVVIKGMARKHVEFPLWYDEAARSREATRVYEVSVRGQAKAKTWTNPECSLCGHRAGSGINDERAWVCDGVYAVFMIDGLVSRVTRLD